MVWRTLDGWDEPPELAAEAVAAGVPLAYYRERIEQLRNTTIGGSAGVRDRTKWVRSQFGRWRTWVETESARASGARRRDVPNQPNCGLTGLEKAIEVK